MGASKNAKLSVPRSASILRRPRVVREIARHVQNRFCWIAAPAGSGKTTAVLDHLYKSRRPVIWYRIDDGDRDIASFFHYLSLAAPAARRHAPLPVFGGEYADQPLEFARRFFRAWFDRVRAGTTWVIDDLHYADEPVFRRLLAVALDELPARIHCICVSRGPPFNELGEMRLRGQLGVVDYDVLSFSDREARALLRQRLPRPLARKADTAIAGGWAAGLVLVSEQLAAAGRSTNPDAVAQDLRAAVFATLARQLFAALTPIEQDLLMRISLPREISTRFAIALTGNEDAEALLAALHRRQIFITRRTGQAGCYRFHDLFRGFLQAELQQRLPPADLAALQSRAASLLAGDAQPDEAIDLALTAGDWTQARRLIVNRAESALREGRRVTFATWCERLPAAERAAERWLGYWLGVAHLADDARAEQLLEAAFNAFAANGDRRGAYLAVAEAVLSKTDSWRTHDGLDRWTRRSLGFLSEDVPGLSEAETALGWSGTLRALEFSQDFTVNQPAMRRLLARMSEWLETPRPGQDPNLRLSVSQSLIEYAGTAGERLLFERATDSVVDDLRNPAAAPWHVGLWLVSFGAMSGRYFPYRRREFPYRDAREALAAAAAIGARERLRGVEFGALYHQQLLAKLNGDLAEFGTLIDRLAEIADSRYTTQVAVVADCQAARLTLEGTPEAAYPACRRFNAAIEAANEPPIERWPHYITEFQVLLGAGRHADAQALLRGILRHFDGEVRRRTEACIGIAAALALKPGAAYDRALRTALTALAESDYFAALLNLPGLLATLCADGLERGIQTELCTRVIRRRRLAPPRRTASWPWALTVQVLGGFTLRLEGRPVEVGAKAPRKSQDLLKLIATARDHSIALEEVYDTLWPDADGAQAKAACDQALHRLRKWLGRDDLVLQREGQLRFDTRLVFVDLDAWEREVRELRGPRASPVLATELDAVLERFPGPLLGGEVERLRLVKVALHVERQYFDAATRLAQLNRQAGSGTRGVARIQSRALQHFPQAAVRWTEGVVGGRRVSDT